VTDRIAAAVCYRRCGAGVEFLLVRTKGGDRWTFPKGHVKTREEPHAAAVREACEEAGAHGWVDTTPVGRYRYPATRKKKRNEDDVVEAYLLKVQTQIPPDESFRTPTWCTPAQARKRLAKDRESKYVEEHARILTAALDALKAGQRDLTTAASPARAAPHAP